MADHLDTSAQAQRLGAVLKEAGIATTVFGAAETNHTKVNDNLGLSGDPTLALAQSADQVLRK
jgi:hypothetical protein